MVMAASSREGNQANKSSPVVSKTKTANHKLVHYCLLSIGVVKYVPK